MFIDAVEFAASTRGVFDKLDSVDASFIGVKPDRFFVSQMQVLFVAMNRELVVKSIFVVNSEG